MSTIRRQSIISSGIIYFGIALGALSTFLQVRWLAPAQYGLLSMFVAIGTIMYSIGSLGMYSFIGRFYPYYKDFLPPKKNDMMTWALLSGLIGFLLVIIAGIVFRPQVIKIYGNNSSQLVHYYYWLFPFGFGLTIYSLLETYAWQLKKSVLTNYLREVQWRLFTLALLGLLFMGWLTDFSVFVKLYAFTFLAIAAILFIYLLSTGDLRFTLTPSKVTRKLLRFMLPIILTGWSGGMIFNIAFFFAQLIIAAVMPNGLAFVAIYTIANYTASLIQAAQRGVLAAAVGPISQAWKDRDLGRIQRIYSRSSINQLIFSVAIFLLISLNFADGILTFHLKPEYLAAQYVFLFIGLTRVVDMGTGVNTQIIATSIYWRVDFIAGLILLAFTLPLNYLLVKRLGAVGPAIADLITFTLYNAVRCCFLYWKYKMQPFTWKTFYTLLLGVVAWLVCHLLFHRQQGFIWLVIRSLTFLAIYAPGVLILRLSEDVQPIWATVRKRLRLGGGSVK
jgi:O-antigen/teichoic acid export membrane protein